MTRHDMYDDRGPPARGRFARGRTGNDGYEDEARYRDERYGGERDGDDRFDDRYAREANDRYGDRRMQRGGRRSGPGAYSDQRGRSGLRVFDKTLQTTNIWLNEIADVLGPDKQHAWKVLSVVLHTLRDRLQVDDAAHLGAQLPLLIRGLYYDQFKPARQPTECDLEDFIAEVDEWLADARPTDPREAIAAVFQVLSRHIPVGEIDHVQQSLPRDLRRFWREAEERVTPPPGSRRGPRYYS
jgi:uncharacterized protein (DUF2267 family)